jgi:DNA-binding CsgD family transcriptional regulator
MMAHCVTCGSELHPERAEKYNYCTRRACRERNARPLTIAAVAVNKAADQYLVLDERARADLAAGKFQDQRKSSSVTDGPPRERVRAPSRERARPATAGTRPRRQRGHAPPQRRPSWSPAQEQLALVYSAQGMRPDEIAERLGLSRYTVTQLLLSAKDGARPSAP